MAAGFKIRDGVLVRYSGQEKTIEIPEGVQEIRENAFRDCGYLQAVHLPAGLKKIAVDAFRRCYALKDITVDKDNETYASEDGILLKDCRRILVTTTIKMVMKHSSQL